MILLSLIAEIVACIMTIISPVIENKTIFAFVIAGIIKVVLLIILDMDKDFKSVLTSTVISFVFYIGITLKLVLNIPTSQLNKEVILGVVGIIIGCMISKLVYSNEHLILNIKYSEIITGIATLTLLSLCALVYKLFMVTDNNGKPLGDGSIAIGSFSLQLPEIIKIFLILVTFITSVLMHKRKGCIWFAYISSVFFCVLIAFYFKEYGTPLIILYFTVAIGISLGSNQKYKGKCKNQASDFLNSGNIPCVAGTLFFFAIKILKDVLYNKYPLRGISGEEIYESEDWFYRSQRLWADAPQTVEARSILKNAPFIPMNLNFDVRIPNCEPETAISDYCIVVLSLGFGKLIATLLIIAIVALLVFTFIKSDYLGKAASTMLISQIIVQVSGVIGFCFTGVNIPFISAGASSMFSSFVLITFIICSMRRKNNA